MQVDVLRLGGVDEVAHDKRVPPLLAAQGHRAALDCLLAEPAQLLTLNLGSGQGASVLEVVQAFERASGREVPYDVVARRAGDAAITVADPALALKRIGWQTKRTLDDICRDGWAWQSAHPAGYGDLLYAA